MKLNQKNIFWLSIVASRACSYPCQPLHTWFQLTVSYPCSSLSYGPMGGIEISRDHPISTTLRLACSLIRLLPLTALKKCKRKEAPLLWYQRHLLRNDKFTLFWVQYKVHNCAQYTIDQLVTSRCPRLSRNSTLTRITWTKFILRCISIKTTIARAATVTRLGEEIFTPLWVIAFVLTVCNYSIPTNSAWPRTSPIWFKLTDRSFKAWIAVNCK